MEGTPITSHQVKLFKESEGKDFRKNFKDIREGKDFFEFPSMGVVEPIERLARLERIVNQLMHFISPDLCPDLNAAASYDEAHTGQPIAQAVARYLSGGQE